MRVKNKFAYILLILFIILSIVVIYMKFSYDKVQKLYRDAVSNLAHINNYSFEQKLSISYNDSDFSKSVSGKIDEEGLKYSYTYSDGALVYGMVIDGNNYVFSQNEDGSYITIKSDYDMYSVRKLGKFLQDQRNVRKVDSNNRSLTKYKIIVNAKTLRKYVLRDNLNVLNQLNILDDDSDLLMYVYVDKDKNVTKVSFDLKNYIKNVKFDSNKIKKIIIDLDIKDINNITNIIPDEVVNSDVDYSKLNYKPNPYSEEQIMYDIILSATVYCKAGSIDFSRYENELNDYLQLNEYSIDSIKEGAIKIDSDCNVEVKKDFKINDKICTYDNVNYESCK